jgi:hypothetical protein
MSDLNFADSLTFETLEKAIEVYASFEKFQRLSIEKKERLMCTVRREHGTSAAVFAHRILYGSGPLEAQVAVEKLPVT